MATWTNETRNSAVFTNESVSAASAFYLLMETLDHLLMETGDDLLLETTGSVSWVNEVRS